ncbi:MULTISPECIES: hypothetical protein [Bradyrhizobium]|uniref:hypothetical protein n=1 Tax=Bradyrhizobium TaxID=374 RepID=UPI0011444D22|nr:MULTISPECIES: hypothetical protein [Bradyrhizobium]UFW47062.1 hypothetical protein BaraCB756_32965 [Bradyrhizobium arachidis]
MDARRHVGTIAFVIRRVFLKLSFCMHEIPPPVVVDLQAAACKFSNETGYGEIDILNSLRQPDRMVSRNSFRLVTVYLAGSNAAGLFDPLRPVNCRADRNSKLLGGWLRDITPSIAATTRSRRSGE